MQPLADRLRPKTLNEFVGQSHLVGRGKPIRVSIKQGQIRSMIFWGPPGCGKTTLARIIASEMKAQIHYLTAVSAGKKDVKAVIDEARTLFGQQRTILFLDEIHRFNKAQQDFLLPYVEDGTIILIGATTENPSFEIISPLLSRSQVFVLHELTEADLRLILTRGANELTVAISDEAKDFLVGFANGDGRQLLNLLETASDLYANPRKERTLTLKDIKATLQSKHLRFDKAGEEHYNTISAFIKSMRASNVDAALYYLARMVDAGEDPLFIARRMVIFASEDIGMAQPTALVVANGVFRACEVIGYPECQINLAHGVTYLASAKKDRSAYEAYFAALDDVKKLGNLPIPMNLRNAPTKLMKELGYGKGYVNYSKDSLLPDTINNKKYYKG
jgi:putative ATPase